MRALRAAQFHGSARAVDRRRARVAENGNHTLTTGSCSTKSAGSDPPELMTSIMVFAMREFMPQGRRSMPNPEVLAKTILAKEACAFPNTSRGAAETLHTTIPQTSATSIRGVGTTC